MIKTEQLIKPLLQQGGSIVDYLKSKNRKADIGSRRQLAAEYGIKNYKGTADQNITLLNLIKQNDKAIEDAEFSDSNILNEITVQGYGPEYRKQVSDYMNSLSASSPEMRGRADTDVPQVAQSILNQYQSVMSPDDIARFKYRWDLDMNTDEQVRQKQNQYAAQEQLAGYQFQQRAKAGLPTDYTSTSKYISNWDRVGSYDLHQDLSKYYADEIAFGKERSNLAAQRKELQGYIDDLKQSDFNQGVRDAQNNALQTGLHIASTGFRLPSEFLWGSVKDITTDEPLKDTYLKRRLSSAFEGNGTYLTDVIGDTGNNISDFIVNTVADPFTWMTLGQGIYKNITPAKYKISTYTRGPRQAFSKTYDVFSKPQIKGNTRIDGFTSVDYTIPKQKIGTRTVNYKELPVKQITRKKLISPETIQYNINSIPVSQGGINIKPESSSTPFDINVPLADLYYNPKTEIIKVGSYGSPEFQKAFGIARKQGLPTFQFGNTTYTTDLGTPSKSVVVKSREEGYPKGSTFIPVDTNILKTDNAVVNNPLWNVENAYSKPYNHNLFQRGLIVK